jgi:hypothetical protein
VFTTQSPVNCKSINPKYGPNLTYKFSNVEPGEYILIVTTRCDEKYVIEKLTTSLIVK